TLFRSRQCAAISDPVDHVLISAPWPADHHRVSGARQGEGVYAVIPQPGQDVVRAQRVARLCVRKRIRDQVQDSEALAGLCGGVMGELAPLIESVRVVEEGQLTAKSAGLGGLAAPFRLEYPNGTRAVAER